MQKRHTSSLKSAQQGVVILEAMIAILIFSFALLGIIGLQAAMIKNTAESKYRGDASYLANQTIALMWTYPQYIAPIAPPNVVTATFSYPSNSQGLLPNIGALLPNGTSTVVYDGTTGYTVTMKWQAPGEDPHTFTTFASIAGNQPGN